MPLDAPVINRILPLSFIVVLLLVFWDSSHHVRESTSRFRAPCSAIGLRRRYDTYEARWAKHSASRKHPTHQRSFDAQRPDVRPGEQQAPHRRLDSEPVPPYPLRGGGQAVVGSAAMPGKAFIGQRS